jgi:Arc/MetJ family transcription regulator
MRTQIILDEGLVAEAMRYANVKTWQELVDLALREVVAARRSEAIAGCLATSRSTPRTIGGRCVVPTSGGPE